MTKLGKLLLILLIIIILIIIAFTIQKKPAVVPVEIPKENPVVDTSMPPMQNKTGIEGNKDDLVSFTIAPYTKVHGILSYRGVIKGAYFFEANIRINILDANKKVLKASNAVATTEWATVEPVSFEGNIDFTGLPKGPGFFEIHNDNPSDLPANDKSVRIPIVIE